MMRGDVVNCAGADAKPGIGTYKEHDEVGNQRSQHGYWSQPIKGFVGKEEVVFNVFGGGCRKTCSRV